MRLTTTLKATPGERVEARIGGSWYAAVVLEVKTLWIGRAPMNIYTVRRQQRDDVFGDLEVEVGDHDLRVW